MAPKKILFVLATLDSGGAERQTIDLINRLDRERFLPTLCYLRESDGLKPLILQDRLSGLYCLGKKHRFDFSLLLKLRALIKESAPDTVVCVTSYPAFYAHLLRIVFGLKFRLIEVLHTTIMPDRFYEMMVRYVYRHLSNLSDGVVFVCRKQMEHWIECYGIRRGLSRIIYNGVDTERFSPSPGSAESDTLRASLGIAPNETVICICATLGPAKRHVDLVDALALLRSRGRRVKLLVVGEGREREALEKHIEACGVRDAVITTGFKLDVRPYVAISDIFAIVSNAVETFSIAVLEAMAMGKALVLSDLGGASEQVLPGVNGWLFPPEDVKALAASLCQIIDSKQGEAMGLRSRAMVCERFSMAQMVANYEALLRG